jgi:hypothetical protein
MNQPDEGESVRATLIKVMTMQVAALAVLALLQYVYNK